MTALAASVIRPSKTHPENPLAMGVNAGSVIYGGAMVCREAATNLAVPAADTTGLVFMGVALDELDNTSGDDGAVVGGTAGNVRTVRVDRDGEYAYTVSTGTPRPGGVAYVVDDNTVRASANTNGIVAGIFTRQHSSGVWFVDHSAAKRPAAAAVASLAGTLTGTADGTMVDVAAAAGSCAGGSSPSATNVDTAIATAVAPIVTGVNTQNKEMQTTINAILASLRAAGIVLLT